MKKVFIMLMIGGFLNFVFSCASLKEVKKEQISVSVKEKVAAQKSSVK